MNNIYLWDPPEDETSKTIAESIAAMIEGYGQAATEEILADMTDDLTIEEEQEN